MSDSQSISGKTYVAYLFLSDTVFTRFKYEIEQVVRTLTSAGLGVVALIIQEGDSGSGSIIDPNISTFRFASQDFVVTQLAPGLDLIVLERNLFVMQNGNRSSDATTTAVASDFTYFTWTMVLPGPATSTWKIDVDATVLVASTVATRVLTVHVDIVHSGGTVAGASLGDAVGTANQLVMRHTEAHATGIAGGQTVTLQVLIQQDGAGTLTMSSAVGTAFAVREN